MFKLYCFGGMRTWPTDPVSKTLAHPVLDNGDYRRRAFAVLAQGISFRHPPRHARMNCRFAVHESVCKISPGPSTLDD
jgi:hypothetical protein